MGYYQCRKCGCTDTSFGIKCKDCGSKNLKYIKTFTDSWFANF